MKIDEEYIITTTFHPLDKRGKRTNKHGWAEDISIILGLILSQRMKRGQEIEIETEAVGSGLCSHT